MKVSRFEWDGDDPAWIAAEIRSIQPQLGEVSAAVTEIVEGVERGGDAAVLRYEEKFGGVLPASLRVPESELSRAPDAIPSELADAIAARSRT